MSDKVLLTIAVLIPIAAFLFFAQPAPGECVSATCGQLCGQGVRCPSGCGCNIEIGQPWGVCQ